MTLTEIKKVLYKEKPLAHFDHCRKDARGICLLYFCVIGPPESDNIQYFRVPIEDIGDAVFPSIIYSQLLIRYIIQPEIEQT
jgi:hypothetical protein